LVSAAAAVTLSDGKIESARFALGGVGTRPWRVSEAERALAGAAPSETAFRNAADICLKGARPQSHNGFKVELAKRAIVRAFKLVTS
jgi:xanthine dehydrogenase YagS FAD-binding subunit